MKDILALFVLFILCPILAPVMGWWTLIPIVVSGLWLVKKHPIKKART